MQDEANVVMQDEVEGGEAVMPDEEESEKKG